MDAPALLVDLRAAKADLWIDAGRLRVKAPAGVLTPERREAIAADRDALLALLVEEADEWALDRLDAALGDDGWGPEPPAVAPGGCCLCGAPLLGRTYLCVECSAESQRRADALWPVITELSERRLAKQAAVLAARGDGDDPFTRWMNS